jgi:hypothetical protein
MEAWRANRAANQANSGAAGDLARLRQEFDRLRRSKEGAVRRLPGSAISCRSSEPPAPCG